MRASRKAESAEMLRELHNKVAQLEHMIHQLSRPVIEHVTIERVYVQNPVLEHLEFGLDTIDIKELSGSLNLGNNFGLSSTPPNGKKHPKPEKQHSESSGVNKEISSTSEDKGIGKAGPAPFRKEATQTGYRFRTNDGMGAKSEKEG